MKLGHERNVFIFFQIKILFSDYGNQIRLLKSEQKQITKWLKIGEAKIICCF